MRLRVAFRVSVILVFLLSAGLSTGAEFSYLSYGNREALAFTGRINQGDYDRLLAFIRQDKERFLSAADVSVNSGGGMAVDAIRIGELFRKTFKTVHVDTLCGSSCFFIYISGVARDMQPGTNGRIGIHGPHFVPEPYANLSPAETKRIQSDLKDQVVRYLQQNRVPQKLIDKMFSLSTSAVYWLSQAELDEVGRYSPLILDYMTARCGHGTGKSLAYYLNAKSYLFTDEYRRQFLSELSEYNRCMDDVSGREARQYLNELVPGGHEASR